MSPSVACVAAVRDVVELRDRVVAFDADWHLFPRLSDEYRRWRSGRWTLIRIISAYQLSQQFIVCLYLLGPD